MEQFMERGKLDPKINPTQADFLKIFALWILDEDLPWTTGKAMLDKFFKYLRSSSSSPATPPPDTNSLGSMLTFTGRSWKSSLYAFHVPFLSFCVGTYYAE
jgi:hypothetical protein